MKTIVVIPAYNEAKTIGAVLDAVRPFVDRIVVVDDGGMDATADIARASGAMIYRHVVNRGLGASLGTGIAAALRGGADIIVTMDGDGQHRAEDIPSLVAPIAERRADVVLGVRTRDRAHMPITRRVANICANILTWILFGVWTSDSQSGFRAFARHAAEQLDIKGDRMEVSSEILSETKRLGLRFAEVPIAPIYTAYSLSKGQGFREGLRTIERLFIRRFFR
ncbi:glycosyltransferase family 2 protein [Candidatus Uhrbacteria bacterium]|nr:glycosyltransferase family 2 protein [Candidatus Uhrbacteria bacterium]